MLYLLISFYFLNILTDIFLIYIVLSYTKNVNDKEMQTYLLIQTLVDTIPGTFLAISTVSFSLRIADPEAVNINYL